MNSSDPDDADQEEFFDLTISTLPSVRGKRKIGDDDDDDQFARYPKRSKISDVVYISDGEEEDKDRSHSGPSLNYSGVVRTVTVPLFLTRLTHMYPLK